MNWWSRTSHRITKVRGINEIISNMVFLPTFLSTRPDGRTEKKMTRQINFSFFAKVKVSEVFIRVRWYA